MKRVYTRERFLYGYLGNVTRVQGKISLNDEKQRKVFPMRGYQEKVGYQGKVSFMSGTRERSRERSRERYFLMAHQ